MIELDWQLIEAGRCSHPEASSRSGASWRACEFPALVSLLRHPREGWILFDTGYGQAFMDATRHFPESLYRRVTPVSWRPEESAVAQIASRGVSPGDVRHVLLSHFHGDHAGGLPDFPSAHAWCAETAWQDLHGRSRLSALSAGLLPALVPRSESARLKFVDRTPLTRLPEALAPFGTGHDLFGDESLYAVPLPGHAVGHYGVCFRSAGNWVFLVGDAAWSTRAIEDNVPPPRWATALLGDTAIYRATLASLHALSRRRSGVLLVPSHCRSFRP